MSSYTPEELRNNTKSGGHRSWCTLVADGPDVDKKIFDLRFIENWELETLEKISISRNPLTKIRWSQLEKCSSLKELIIRKTNLQDVNLEPLSILPIKKLWLEDCLINSIDLSPLENCKDLEFLNLGSNFIREINLSPLEKTEKLNNLTIGANKLKEIDLYPLEQLKLKKLHITTFDRYAEIDFIPIRNMSSLESLFYSFEAEDNDELSPFLDGRTTIRYEKIKHHLKTDKELNIRCEISLKEEPIVNWFGIKSPLKKSDVPKDYRYINIRNLVYKKFEK
jgi:hypothetical protein